MKYKSLGEHQINPEGDTHWNAHGFYMETEQSKAEESNI